jgi:ComF family protein
MYWLEDLKGLLFPEACVVCAAETRIAEAGLCLFCRHELPVVLSRPLQNHLPMVRKFEGLYPVSEAFAFLQFGRSGNTRKILHALKYGRKPETGLLLGRLLAGELLERGLRDSPDLIIPVPMHPDKQRQRGYNQAMEFAIGLAAGLGCAANDQILLKRKLTETQTRKNKLARILNTSEVFVLNEEKRDLLAGKKIWLADDVLTTGSTMMASAAVLHKEPLASLGMVSIAMA